MAREHEYATTDEVAAGFRPLSEDEEDKCAALIIEAGIMIDAVAPDADYDAKMLAVCRMVRRAIGSGEDAAPMGATQGSVSALGYSQSWTLGTGSTGELYIGKAEKTLLGISNRIGASNPYGGDRCAARHHCNAL